MAIIIGTPGNDTEVGTNASDLISLGKGQDFGSGLQGNDIISGGGGDDILSGGDGRDRLLGGGGNDELLGESGADELNGDNGEDLLFGGGGNDLLRGGNGADELFGRGGDDVLLGGAGADVLEGGADSAVSLRSVGDGISEPGGFQVAQFDDDPLLARVVAGAAFGDDLPFPEDLSGLDIVWQVTVESTVPGVTIIEAEGVGDVITGGAGVDTFVVGADDGVDLLLGFERGVDRVELADGLEVAAFLTTSVSSDGVLAQISQFILERPDGTGSATVVIPDLFAPDALNDIFFPA